MLKPEQVPNAVIEEAVAMRDRGGSMSDIIRTAINAWPGMETVDWYHADKSIILPMPTENTNAEA